MNFRKFKWLEIAEYITILFSIITLIIYFTIDQIHWFLSFLLISLILNIINRSRLEKLNRHRLTNDLKIELDKVSAEINQLKEIISFSNTQSEKLQPPDYSSDKIEKSDNAVIAFLQEDLDVLETSISSIIEYINQYLFPKRIDILENSYKYLKEEINTINETINMNQNIALSEKNLLSNESINDLFSPPNIISWKCVNILSAHSESVTGLAINTNNKYLASISWDQYLKLWSLEDGNLIDEVKASEQGLLAISWKKDTLNNNNSFEYSLATGSFDQNIKIWSLITNNHQLKIKLEHNVIRHTGSIHSLDIASKQNILVSGSYDQTLKQWDLDTGEMLKSSYDEHGAVYAVAIHEQGEFIISGGGDGSIKILELGTGKTLGLLTGNIISIESIAIDSSGQLIAAGCVDGTIKIWELTPNIFIENQPINPILTIQAHQGQIMSLLFSPDGQLLYSGGVDGQIKIWYPNTGKSLGHLKISNDNRIFSLALSSDGKLLAAGGMDGTIKIWLQNQ